MKNKILLMIGIAPAMLFSCKPTPCADVLFKKDTTVESERKNTLFAFVGEKIEIKQLSSAEDSSIIHLRGKYKVLQQVYGCYPGDTIEFSAIGYYGWPPFSRYNTVLLFLSRENGEYYDEGYAYNDVYMTSSGKWAGPWLSDDKSGYDSTGIIPQPMDFVQKVAYPLSDTMDIGNLENPQFPHPFFWTVGDSAIAQYGSYIEDIFKVKKEGLLKLQGLFGVNEEELRRHGQVQDVQLEAVDVQLEEAPPPTFEETAKRFKSFWYDLGDSAEKSGRFPFQHLLPDSFWVCGSLFTRQRFMQECHSKVFDSSFHAQWKRYVNVDIECGPANLRDLLPSARKRVIKEKDGYGSIRVQVLNVYAPKFYHDFYLSFIETKQGFKIYDIRFANNRSCCF